MKAIELLDDIADEIDVALTQVRDVVQGLYPALLQDQGLFAALEPVCRRSPIEVHVNGAMLGRFDEEIETAVYYVCLEALQNAAKHGGLGTRADVNLKQEGDLLLVRISDTGPGFEPAGVRAGTGLQNMRSRIEVVGGTFELSSAVGRGTTVSAWVPLRGSSLARQP
jgi:signal transduction histidine kinase